MKYILLIIFACISHLAVAAKQSINLGTAPGYAPFEFLGADGTLQGFDIDLANALCVEMKVECKFTTQSYDTLISSLKFRQLDAVISAVDVTEERKKQVSFTQTYYSNAAVFIAKKGGISSWKDLGDKPVGVLNGSTHQQYLLKKQPQIKSIAYDNLQNAILDLTTQRISAVFGDQAVIMEWLKHDDTLVDIGSITDQEFFGTGLAIVVNKKDTELLRSLDDALTRIKENGTYQTIVDKWFN